MADPEQIYQEVLQEEQGKGSASAVAEGRAKAARARAEHGSPHPKEPRWWPGAQPQFEGNGAAPAPAESEPEPAAEAEPEAEPAAEPEPEPAAEPEAEPAAEPEPEPAAEPEPQPAAAAPAPEPAPAPAPASQVAAAPAAAPAAAAVLPPEERPMGATHGTATGTRLRPEDEVTTEAQFAGEAAMQRRRKLIDELVATGVPEVTAHETGTRSPFLALLYIIIPLIAIALLVSQEGPTEAAPPAGDEQPADGGGSGEGVLSAANVLFDTDSISLPADGGPLEFSNEDSVPHNVSIYPDTATADAQSDALFQGELVDPGASTTYEVPPLDPGEYVFQCDIHPNMRGTATVQ